MREAGDISLVGGGVTAGGEGQPADMSNSSFGSSTSPGTREALEKKIREKERELQVVHSSAPIIFFPHPARHLIVRRIAVGPSWRVGA